MRTVFIIVLCALLFVASIDCKKVSKTEKVKTKHVKAEQDKSKIPEASVASEDVVEKKVSPVEVVKEVAQPVVVEEDHKTEAAEITSCQESVGEPAFEVVKPKLRKPKSLKVITEYEKCKMECRKQRDSVQMEEYVAQLRTELAEAEKSLAEQLASAAAEEELPVEQEAIAESA